MKLFSAILLAAVSSFGLSACKQQSATTAETAPVEAQQPVAANEPVATDAAQAADAAAQPVDASAAAPVGGVPTSGSK